jgi:glycosyltransferase involved in cell wall biosynthesis
MFQAWSMVEALSIVPGWRARSAEPANLPRMPEPSPPIRGPVAVGGLGGSGTRLVAAILREAGLDLGPDLNASLDNLWFTLLLVRPRWLPRALRRHDPALRVGLETFRDAMEGRLRPSARQAAFIARATAGTAASGHDLDGHGRGRWATARARSLLSEGRRERTGPWGWKEPATYLLLEELAAAIPGVRYVHVVRNGLDMAFSRNQHHTRAFGPALGIHPGAEPSPGDALAYWLAANDRAVSAGRDALGDRFVLVRYDDLVTNPGREAGRLLDALGLDAPAVLLERVAALASPPPFPSHRDDDLAALDPAGVEAVAAWGFEVRGPVPGLAERMAGGRREGPVRLSVAMCTFDGARYLPEQLESVAGQTRLPDELVVCDDGSSDATLELLEDFARVAPFPVRIHPSEGERLGPGRNFGRAIERCEGAVIALSDQDDAWRRDRLERIEEAFAAAPGLALYFTDAELVDGRGRSLGTSLWTGLGAAAVTRQRFVEGDPETRVRVLGEGNLVTGATLAFRAGFRDLILPIPEGWIHDAWIGLLLAATAEVHMSPERTIRYRLHAEQQVGVGSGGLTRLQHLRRRMQLIRRTTKRERPAFASLAKGLEEAAGRLEARSDAFPVGAGVLSALRERAAHFEARSRMGPGRRWPAIRRELRAGRYHRYSNGWPSVAKDLLLLDRLGKA